MKLAVGDVIGHRFPLRNSDDELSRVSPRPDKRDLAPPLEFSWLAGGYSSFEITRQLDADLYLAMHIVSEFRPGAHFNVYGAESVTGVEDDDGEEEDEDAVLRFYNSEECLVQRAYKRDFSGKHIVAWTDIWQASPSHKNIGKLYQVLESGPHLLMILENLSEAIPVPEFLQQRARSAPSARMSRMADIFAQMCHAFIACPELQLCQNIDLDDFVVVLPSLLDPPASDSFTVKLFSFDVRIDRDPHLQDTQICNHHDPFALRNYRVARQDTEGQFFLNPLHPTSILALSRLLFKMFLPIFAPWLSQLSYPPLTALYLHRCTPSTSLVRSLAKDAMKAVQAHFRTCFALFRREIGEGERQLWSALCEEVISVIGAHERGTRGGGEIGGEFGHGPDSKSLTQLPSLRINGQRWTLHSDTIHLIISRLDHEQTNVLAEFLHAHMDIILLLDPVVRRPVQKLIRRLYEKADSLPAEMEYDCPSINRDHPVCVGGYADVYLGLDSRGAASVALKKMRVLSATDPDKARRRFRREVLVMHMIGLLSHPNVIPFLGIETQHWPNQLPCIVTQWMKNGTVIAYLETRIASMREVDLQLLLRGISAGLLFLHEEGVVHGDLCGRNILVDHTGTPRLADFSLSWFTSATKKTITSEAGSLRWMAPELLDPKISFERTPASDVYALGCTFWEISTGLLPFYESQNDYAVLVQISNGLRPSRAPQGGFEFWRTISDWQWDVIESCWQQNPLDRSDIGSVFQVLGLAH